MRKLLVVTAIFLLTAVSAFASDGEKDAVDVGNISWAQTEEGNLVTLKFTFDVTNNTHDKAAVYIDFGAKDFEENHLDSFSYTCEVEPEKTQTFTKSVKVEEEKYLKIRSWAAERVSVYKAK